MDEGFQELKQQLVELSETVNKFESEAVQLRIVELFFEERAQQFGHLSENGADAYEPGPGKLGKPGEKGHSAAKPSRRKSANGSSASGAVAVLSKLIDSGFFDEKRTIRDVVAACEKKFGVRYMANAFSGPLSRHAKNGSLKRERNTDGKYVYFT